MSYVLGNVLHSIQYTVCGIKITEFTWQPSSSQHGLLHFRRRREKKRNTRNQHTITCFQENRIYIYFILIISLYLDLSRCAAQPMYSMCAIVQCTYMCSIRLSHFTSRTNVGSATFHEPCPQFCVLCFVFGKYLKEVSSGVELKMVHVLAYLTMQFR